MGRLSELAALYGTDKGQAQVPSGLSPKGYTELYEKLIGEQEVNALLELGVARGASIRMWEAFLPEALIIGLDKGRNPLRGDHPRVRIYRAFQSDRAALERIAREHGPFDVIIDDGSHKRADQLASFGILWRHLAPGGFYAIEDLHAATAIDAGDVDELELIYGPLEVITNEAGTLVVLAKPIIVG